MSVTVEVGPYSQPLTPRAGPTSKRWTGFREEGAANSKLLHPTSAYPCAWEHTVLGCGQVASTPVCRVHERMGFTTSTPAYPQLLRDDWRTQTDLVALRVEGLSQQLEVLRSEITVLKF